MDVMDHLMAEKLTKIIKTAKWGKSHKKIFKKNFVLLAQKELRKVANFPYVTFFNSFFLTLF